MPKSKLKRGKKVNRYCGICGKELKFYKKVPAEQYVRVSGLPSMGMPDLSYPKFDPETGKKAYFKIYSCPNFKEEVYGLWSNKKCGNGHDQFIDKGNLEKMFSW